MLVRGRTVGGSVQGLSSQPDSTATVDFKGKVDARSPFSVTGKINPLSQDLFADIAVTFTNTELTSFTPYTEKLRVARWKREAVICRALPGQRKALDAQNGFYVDQLTLGAKNNSPDATSLPVKLAIALLKDRSGRIKLDVPVKGRIDDPKFRLGPIIWHVVVNLIEEGRHVPVLIAGRGVWGRRRNELRGFQPGQTAFVVSETNKVDKLAKSMNVPSLRMTLTASIPRPTTNGWPA